MLMTFALMLMSAALTFKSHPTVVSGLITVYLVDPWLILDSRRQQMRSSTTWLVNLLGSPSPSYSPATTPKAQAAEPSESESPCIPDFMTLTVLDFLDYLLVPTDEVVELSAQLLHLWWEADSGHGNYVMFASNWLDHIKQHVVVNGFNQEPTQQVPGYQLCYLHSTRATLRR
eukprot:291900-Amphidinium_carterae.1